MTSLEALCANEPELAAYRHSIRGFLRGDQAHFGWEPAIDAWLSRWDEDFSVRLGAAGFLGSTIPVQYGGHGLTHMHRYVVTEELLSYGAPVAAHWMADRQLAPALLAHGTEEQRHRLLPDIAAGRLYYAVGMSEHEAGSDLAAVQTRAARAVGGWILNGTKVWTSGAHLAHQIVVLARTSATDPRHRHQGLSQFLVPTTADGLTISPIAMMSGEHHFNEVQFDDVFVPDHDVLGEIGAGWQQATAELSFERCGPERVLSTATLITAAIAALAAQDSVDATGVAGLGDLIARLISLRLLSVSVARSLTQGHDAASRAALVKDLGTRFEQDSVGMIADLLNDTTEDPYLEGLLAEGWLHKPVFTLRGGTNEVLRGVVARQLRLR